MEQEVDLVQRMKEKAEAVQTIVSDVENISQAFQYTVELTRKQGGSAS